MNLNYLIYIALCFCLAIDGCKSGKPEVPKPKNGQWEMQFTVGDIAIPIKLTIQDSVWQIHNASEIIELDSIEWSNNAFFVKMPLFNASLKGVIQSDTTITGHWTDHSRDSLYVVPFTLKHKPRNLKNNATAAQKRIVYDATFSPNNLEDRSRAIGIFDFNGTSITGTFLTETGDYRFLEGYATDQSISLSCFDGTHLFYFCANIDGDSLKEGKFHSGKHWTEEWEAKADASAKLRDPDSLTYLKNDKNQLKFRVRSLNGDSIIFDKEDFEGKVSLVQIFGSWCPNCTDESIFLKELYGKYAKHGFQIIPVAFERSKNFEEAKHSVLRQFQELGLEYAPYFGGISNKGEASHVFSDLNKIMSFPTSIIIDKKGKVRKIHTGFYGPGTGDYYTHHTELLDMFVAQLLQE